MRILIVEDEPAIALPMRRALEREGYLVTLCETGQAATETAQRWQPELIILDRNLPDVDGIDVLRMLRRSSSTPVLLVTGRDAVHERVAGLDAGADDYIVKPFSMDELLARIRRVSRRPAAVSSVSDLRLGDLVLDLEQRRAAREGADLDLTPREFEVLRMLMVHVGNVVTRTDLARAIWGMSPADAGNTLDVHVRRLRAKLQDDAAAPRYIETVRGRGFRFLAAAATPRH